MTREIAEKKMIEKVRELIAIYKEYNPDGDYLTIAIYAKQGYIGINNAHWEADNPDKIKPIDTYC